MKLFDPGRVDPAKLGPKQPDERYFEFIETSSRPALRRVRALLDDWFDHYPDANKHELKRRLITNRVGIQSEFFELCLHALFRRIGAEVQVHPNVSGEGDNKPDFLIRLRNGFDFYLEAVVATGQARPQGDREKVPKSLFANIDLRLESSPYRFLATVISQGPSTPSVNLIVRRLKEYIAGLDHEEVKKNWEERRSGTPIKYCWEGDGWNIEFIPLPSSGTETGSAGQRQLIEFPHPEMVVCNDELDIRKSIKSKLGQHASTDKPYVIAVNGLGMFVDAYVFDNALFGSDQITLVQHADGSQSDEDTRGLDGVWLGRNGPKNERLIGVIGAPQLDVFQLSQTTLRFYENPYIDFPPKARLEGMTRVETHTGRLMEIEGQPLGKFFGLPIGWPNLPTNVVPET